MKDWDYFRSMDLVEAARAIRMSGGERGQTEIFGDAINAVFVASKERTVTALEIEQILGPPDRRSKNHLGEVLEYDWTDMYGPTKYHSTSPFQIIDGVCCGFIPRK